MEVGSSSSGPSVPAIRNKTMKTLTMCARAHKMFPDIAALSGRPDLRLLVLGPGNEKGFVPEFLELSALLWSSPAEFTLVDHNADLGIGATGEERMRALDPIVSLGHVLDQDKPNELHLPLPNEVHALKFFEGDFTAFEYATDHYDAIVALNSIFYLFNNPSFEPFIYPFLKKLVASLKPGGHLFIDKITFDIVREYEANGVDNVAVTNLGAFPNFTYRITRKE